MQIRFPDTQQTYGEFIDHLTCTINHSCNPNTVLFVEKGHVVARSLRVIQPGDELTICYVDSMAPVASRRAALERDHFFHCYCKFPQIIPLGFDATDNICNFSGTRCVSEAQEERRLVAKANTTLTVLHKAQSSMIRKVNEAMLAAHNRGTRKQYEDPEKMANDINSLACATFSKNIEWPDHLHPMAKTHSTIAWLYEKKDLLLPAVRHALTATLLGGYRSGPDFVNLLCDLTQFLGRIAAEAPDAPVFQVADFPVLWHIQTVVRGYGLVLVKTASRVYGGQTGFTLDVCDWFAMMNEGAHPMPGTPEFGPAFEEAQKKLLAWAEMEEGLGIVLPP